MRRRLTLTALVFALIACTPPDAQPSRLDWAIAIHGGAGSTPRDAPPAEREEAQQSLEHALNLGRTILEQGGSSLDAVERVLRYLEDDPRFNAGKGAVFNAEGIHELDASIMNGATLACGAVAGVRTVKNPISLARQVMERTRHVLLAGEGAERFAETLGVEVVPPEYFFTQRRWDALEKARRRAAGDSGGGTVGAVALDRQGHLAAATSTGGLTNKMAGRVGDSPVIGAGTYANDATCAVSGTGKGEQFIRHSVAYSISALMAGQGLSVGGAAERVVGDVLEEGDGGVIAMSAQGEIAMIFNTESMYRGAADSSGRFEVAIWH